MSLLISDEIINTTNYTEDEFRLEIAILLYEKKKIFARTGQLSFQACRNFNFRRNLLIENST